MSSTNTRLKELESAIKLIDKITKRTFLIGGVVIDPSKTKEAVEQIIAVVNSTEPDLPHVSKIKNKKNKKEAIIDEDNDECDMCRP